MQHPLIIPLSPDEQLATLAAGAMDTAARQQTGNAGTITFHHGDDDGSKTIAGPGAGPTGLAPWVGDTTPPGAPTGVTAQSGNGLILAAWGGSLDGGVPPDFDHVQILVDGLDAGRLTAKGTLACGPYEPGTEHTVTAVAWDDAHAEDGSPAPNASPACAPVRVTVTGADIDPGRLGITVTKSDKPPQGRGAHTGDLWLRYTGGYGANIVSDPRGKDFTGQWTYTGAGGTSASNTGATWIRTRPFGSDRWSDLVNKAATQVLHDGDRVRVSARIKAEAYSASQCEVYIGARASKGGSDLSKVTTVTVSGWTTATVDLPITKAGKDGDTFRFVLSVHSTAPSTDTIILATDFSLEPPSRDVLEGEWWWDGTAWVQIPVAIYLDQLAARDVQVDEAVVGMLAAGIIRSGTFVTPDGLVGFDSTGFWVRDTDGGLVFQAGAGGVSMTGSLETASGGDRLRVSRRYLPSLGRSVGALEGLHDDASRWALTGFYDAAKTEVQLSANGRVPNISISSPAATDSDMMVLTGQDVEIGAGRQKTGSSVSVDARTVQVQGITADFADYDPAAWMGWSDSYEDYNHATRLYKRAGVYFLELIVKLKKGTIPSMQTIPVVRLASSIMPDHSLDVLAYGTSYAVGRFHVFGPGESQPQGTISIGTKDTTADFFSGQIFWKEPRKA